MKISKFKASIKVPSFGKISVKAPSPTTHVSAHISSGHGVGTGGTKGSLPSWKMDSSLKNGTKVPSLGAKARDSFNLPDVKDRPKKQFKLKYGTF